MINASKLIRIRESIISQAMPLSDPVYLRLMSQCDYGVLHDLMSLKAKTFIKLPNRVIQIKTDTVVSKLCNTKG